ncbi:MAG: bifunctional adenosylcobinamide kinase/adenosylcobinamide-phosphate guanylyltransferase [Alkalinema sp. RU_4_3]|nr:bifunctional adenosylcobinamide kinase/adenosylcobinamide-phosphate guanylyltransferase [Alkalinema sp. RU_4_3]
MTRQIILVTGPARSGKSEWAEHLAEESELAVLYLATAQDCQDDAEWHQRIEQHRGRRSEQWQTVECPMNLAGAIAQASATDCLLVDSLGTWVANLLEESEEVWRQHGDSLLKALAETPAMVVLVAEETGWGVVPAYPMGRCFRDRLGRLVREVAAAAHVTYLVTAGHALDLSAIATPLTVMASGNRGAKS